MRPDLGRIFMICVLSALSFGGGTLNAQEATREETKRTDTAKEAQGTIHRESQRLQASKSSAARSDDDQACPRVFSESGTVSSAKSWGIRSPDRQVLAWSVAVLQKDPELARGQVFLRNERTGQRETIFETRTKAGKIISTDPHFTDATYNIFCVVDWSPDGNDLLVQEVLGTLYSDVRSDSYWVYNRMRRQRDLIALKPLKQAIENYWQKKALDFREIRYQALAVGWEMRKSNRVVFMAFTYHQEPALFLGIWSVAPTGREPKLLAEKEDGLIVGRFGQIVAAPE
jgi:hypothetical protein